MSWLIESYLEEGKHGPDHPESLNMRNMEDMRKKKEKENKEEQDDSSTTYKLINGVYDKKYDNMYDKVSATKDADIAGKKAILKGDSYNTAKDNYVKDKIRNTKDKSEKNGKSLNDYADKHYGGHRDMVSPSLAKSIRRNEEKNEKRPKDTDNAGIRRPSIIVKKAKINNECAWIAESLQ